jgi:DNA-binding Lrp family transcriptional regulator
MSKKLDFKDLRILEGLAIYGPRNVSEVARKLNMPMETLRKRLKRLRSKIFLKTHVNLYHTNLGLKKAVVFAEAVPGYEDLLFNCLKQNDFWIGVIRGYGMFEGCVGIFTIPKDYCSEFEQFLKEIKQLSIARDIQVFWSTCFHSVHSRCNWFDPKSGTWTFQWDSWIDEVRSERTKLPYTLIDPKDFPVLGDQIDVLILKESEKDATISFEKLAKMLKMSPQLARYHYQKHIIERGLIESFEVTAFHFGRAVSDFFFFIFKFDSFEKLAKFASSLLDKSFVKGIGKILGENTLFGYLYLPKSEFRRFLNALSKLVKTGFLESYRYVIQDLEASSRQTISYEYFKDGKWAYNHKKHLENLQNLVRNAKTRRSEAIEKYV